MKKLYITAIVAACLLAVSTLTAQTATGATGKSVALTGFYSEVHGDAKLVDETLYFLDTPGHLYQLKVKKKDTGLRSHIKVLVKGDLTGDTVDTTTVAGSITATGAPPATVAIGIKTALVINVVWPGATLTATQAVEQNFMFGSDSRTVASYYKDASYGQMTWTGTETPNFSITDPGVCDLGSLANQAEAAANAAGYDTTVYDALMVNAPALHCAAVGYGEIGGKHVWIADGLWNLDDGYGRLVPTHEIGHSLGLYHSHGLECGAVTVDADCLADPTSHNEEYGNAWDVMGNNWPGDSNDGVAWFSAKQEILLGWLGGSRVNTVSTSGTYVLAPLEQSGVDSPQVLQINTPAHNYYIEYRQPLSQDAFLSNYPAATNSVHVNVAASDVSTGPFALDFTPNSDTSSAYSDWFDAPLAMGGSFTDPEGVFTLSPVSQNGTLATVNVTFVSATNYTLSLTTSGTGSGTLTSSPSGINCGTICSATYVSGTPVTLTETPASGSTFSGWGGVCAGTASTCTVAMRSATSVSAAFTAVPTVPSIPTNLKGTPAAAASPYAGSATITWSPPTTGAPITGYTVSRSGTDTNGTGAWSSTVSATTRSWTFSRLKPATTYTLTVKATNAQGTGPAAAVSVTTPTTVPSAPTSVTVTIRSTAGSAKLAWLPPKYTGGRAISGYKITRDGSDTRGTGAYSATLASTARSVTFNLLKKGVTYHLTVQAINSKGGGAIKTKTAKL